jgi:multidrug efflux pump subunit AcrB
MLLDAVRRSNMIDSPGLVEANHQLILSLVSGPAHTPEEIANIVVKTTPAGIPIRMGDLGTVQPSVKPVYTVVTANGKPAVLLSIKRQPDSNTVQVADAVHAEVGNQEDSPARREAAAVLRSVAVHKERARRHPASA